jgi:hypothetical protein
MNSRDVYRKSAKGSAAIATRSPALASRMRPLLIMVDGKRTQGELLALAGGFGDVVQMLGQLEADGLIERLPATAPPAAPPAPPAANPRTPLPAPAPARSATGSLAHVKSFASRRLLELLGPTAEALCVKIEAAQNMADFVAAVKRAYKVVSEVRGAAEADRFGDAVEANLPPT